MNLKKHIAFVRACDDQLARAFLLVADRHGDNEELRYMAYKLAGWSETRTKFLDERTSLLQRVLHGIDALRVRAALFHDPRIGGMGLMRDLEDTLLLAHQVKIGWTSLGQAAQAKGDLPLEQICARAGYEVTRQIQWLETHVKLVAPQALVVEPVMRKQLKASLPHRWTPAALPDSLWAPMSAGVLVGTVALLSWGFDKPWLLASIGPSAYLVAQEGPHPSSRAYNTVVGHLVGLGVGFVAVFALGAGDDPGILSGEVTAARAAASVLAIPLTIGVALPLRATHPPAAATTLLVTAGILSTASDALNLFVGATLVGLLGEPLRQLRMGRGMHRQTLREHHGLRRDPMLPKSEGIA